MFGLFKRKSHDKLNMLIDEFFETAHAVRNKDKTVQVAVGNGINLANSMFNKTFSDISLFQKLNDAESSDYIKKLGLTVEEIAKKDMYTATGFRLFQIWLVLNYEGGCTSEKNINKELSQLSKIGDLSGTTL